MYFPPVLCTGLHMVAAPSPVAVGAELGEVWLGPGGKLIRISEIEEVEVFPDGESRVLELLVGGVTFLQRHLLENRKRTRITRSYAMVTYLVDLSLNGIVDAVGVRPQEEGCSQNEDGQENGDKGAHSTATSQSFARHAVRLEHTLDSRREVEPSRTRELSGLQARLMAAPEVCLSNHVTILEGACAFLCRRAVCLPRVKWSIQRRRSGVR